MGCRPDSRLSIPGNITRGYRPLIAKVVPIRVIGNNTKRAAFRRTEVILPCLQANDNRSRNSLSEGDFINVLLHIRDN